MEEEAKEAFEALKAFIKECDEDKYGLVALVILNPDGVLAFLEESRPQQGKRTTCYLLLFSRNARSQSSHISPGVVVFRSIIISTISSSFIFNSA